MKTSQLQFEIMVQFMEQHGDITKQLTTVPDRMKTLQLWDQLTTLLNETKGRNKINRKTTERWKKVWADLKNNTKKKTARLEKQMKETECGPQILEKLSYIEQRVMRIIGMNYQSEESKQQQQHMLLKERLYQHFILDVHADHNYVSRSPLPPSSPAGDAIPIEKDIKNYCQYKMGFCKSIFINNGVLPSKFHCQPDRRKRTCGAETSQPASAKRHRSALIEQCENRAPKSLWNDPGPSAETSPTENSIPFIINIKSEVLDPDSSETLSAQSEEVEVKIEVADDGFGTPNGAVSPCQPVFREESPPSPVREESPPSPIREEILSAVDNQPTSPPTSKHHGWQKRKRPLPQRSKRLSTDQNFLQYFTQWRRFRSKQHSELMELRREQIRIRERELEVQKKWQELACVGLELVKKAVDKYCDKT